MYKPRTVSVCITSYNHARYLPQTIDSVLSQTWPDLEVIIVDDGSSDSSHELLLTYQQRHPGKIRYYWHEGHANRGISASCNLAIEKAQGEYFAWLGSDDYWLPDKLAKQVKYLAEHPETGMVHTSALTLDAAGNLYPVLNMHETVTTADAWKQLAVGNYICASTVLLVRARLDKVGAYLDEGLVFSDWELWIRISTKYPIGFISEPLAVYRVHGQNVSISAQKASMILQSNLAVIETAGARLPQIDTAMKNKAIANAYVRAGLDSFAGGQCEVGRTYLLRAAQLLDSALPSESEDAFIDAVSAYAIHMLQASGSDAGQSAQFVQNVFTAIAPSLRRRATAEFYVTNAFISKAQGCNSEVRRFVVHAILLNPRWVRNGGVVSLAATAFLGLRVANSLRHLARTFVKTRPRRPIEGPLQSTLD